MDGDIALAQEGTAHDWRAKPSTCPENFTINFRGYDQPAAESLGANLGQVFGDLGRVIDISNLDGVTVAYDYDQALAELDRGCETSYVLERTNDVAIGVAMTPSVLRNDKLKSHIVLLGNVADLITGNDGGTFGMALHTIAHECAHVETTAAWDKCFPGELLRAPFPNLFAAWRWDVTSACWEEYAACRIAGAIGHDPVPGYEETFLKVLSEIDDKVADTVSGFEGGNADPLVASLLGAFGNLMKFACYLQGALRGTGRGRDELGVADALSSSWFSPYFDRLDEACAKIFDEFGSWSDKSGFDVIGDIVVELIESKVAHIWHREDGSYFIHIHHPRRRA